jgi:sodium-dependent dicarboxylate transporter 2/3/5
MNISTEAKLAPKDTMYYVHSTIGLLIVVAFFFLEPIKPITPIGMKVLGIFISMIYLWSFVELLWPSLMGIIMLGLSGYAPMPKVLFKAFGDVVPILVLFAMILFGAIQHHGIARYISRWFLTRKIINGRPNVFNFVFLFTTYVLAALSANVLPVLLFMWSILYSVLEEVGYKKGDRYTALMVIGTLIAATAGQAAKPFTGSALMIVAAFEKVSKTPMDYFPYMLFGAIMSTCTVAIYTFLIRFVFKPDMSRIADISIDRFNREKLPPMNSQQKVYFASLFGYLTLVLLPSVLPKTIPFIGFLTALGAWGIVIGFVVLLCLFKIDGRPIMNFKEIASKYVVWDVYFLVAMAIVVSDALTENSTGIKPFLTETLKPLMGNRSPYELTLIFTLVGMLITQIANNGVMGVLFMPIMQAFAMENGSNPMAIATIMIFALHVAILTPAASPYAAILFANKDWVSPQEVFKYGSLYFMCMAVFYLAVGIPLLNIIFR